MSASPLLPRVQSTRSEVSMSMTRMSTGGNDTRDRDTARRCFEDALRANPRDSFTHHKLGLLLLEEFNDVDGAIQCYEAAIESNPHNAPALNSLGAIFRTRDSGRALHYFEQCLEVDPDYGRAHKNLGLLYRYLKDTDRAIMSLQNAVRVDPQNASAYIALGLCWEEKQDVAQAFQSYSAAVAADSRNPMGHFRLGILMFLKQKDVAAAQRHLLDAAKLAPQDSKIMTKLGHVCAKGQDTLGLARRAYRTALHHNPKQGWIADKIAAVEERAQSGRTDPVVWDDSLIEAESFHLLAAPRGPQREPLLCPRGHAMECIATKPQVYVANATWACEECHKSIGGPSLRFSGAWHCTTCKYDLCAACAARPTKKAHLLLDKPRLLGRGGFAEVYREHDAALDRYVAAKYIRTPDRRAAAAVEHEVRLIQRFAESAHVVCVYGLQQRGQDARVVMELMEHSVADVMARDGAVREAVARGYVRDALLGLAAMHGGAGQAGVVHRDIKPANLLISDNRVKLGDFGLSKDAEATMVQQTVMLKGTPYYMAPEVYSDPPRWSAAGDVWGLGCSWVAMVTGRSPWYGLCGPGDPSWDQLRAALRADTATHPEFPPYLSPGARAVLKLMFQRDPSQRATALELLQHSYFEQPLQGAEAVGDFDARVAGLRPERCSSPAPVPESVVLLDRAPTSGLFPNTELTSCTPPALAAGPASIPSPAVPCAVAVPHHRDGSVSLSRGRRGVMFVVALFIAGLLFLET